MSKILYIPILFNNEEYVKTFNLFKSEDEKDEFDFLCPIEKCNVYGSMFFNVDNICRYDVNIGEEKFILSMITSGGKHFLSPINYRFFKSSVFLDALANTCIKEKEKGFDYLKIVCNKENCDIYSHLDFFN